MKRSVAVLAVAALLMFHPLPAKADAAGKIQEVEGTVTLVHDGASSPAKEGGALSTHDTIETGEKSRVRVTMSDETDLVVAGKGKFSVDDYAYDPNGSGNKATFSFLGTAFSYIGGKMEKKKDANVSLKLDFGSIGIRGTKIYRAMNNKECWIYIERGKVTVSNKGGKVDLKEGQGTIMTMQTKAPLPAHIWSDKDIAWIKSQVADPRLHKKDWK